MPTTRCRAMVLVILYLAFGICFGLRISDFGFETSAPGPSLFGGFPRLGGPPPPSLAPLKAEPFVPQPSPFCRPIPPDTSVASPESRHSTSVGRTEVLRRGSGGTTARPACGWGEGSGDKASGRGDTFCRSEEHTSELQ